MTYSFWMANASYGGKSINSWQYLWQRCISALVSSGVPFLNIKHVKSGLQTPHTTGVSGQGIGRFVSGTPHDCQRGKIRQNLGKRGYVTYTNTTLLHSKLCLYRFKSQNFSVSPESFLFLLERSISQWLCEDEWGGGVLLRATGTRHDVFVMSRTETTGFINWPAALGVHSSLLTSSLWDTKC